MVLLVNLHQVHYPPRNLAHVCFVCWSHVCGCVFCMPPVFFTAFDPRMSLAGPHRCWVSNVCFAAFRFRCSSLSVSPFRLQFIRLMVLLPWSTNLVFDFFASGKWVATGLGVSWQRLSVGEPWCMCLWNSRVASNDPELLWFVFEIYGHLAVRLVMSFVLVSPGPGFLYKWTAMPPRHGGW